MDRKYLEMLVLESGSLETIKNSDFFKNRGINFEARCFHGDKQAEDEFIFSSVIKDYHESGGAPLSHIAGRSQEAINGALSLFQWLTTNIGKGVLEEALNKTGRKTVPLEGCHNE